MTTHAWFSPVVGFWTSSSYHVALNPIHACTYISFIHPQRGLLGTLEQGHEQMYLVDVNGGVSFQLFNCAF